MGVRRKQQVKRGYHMQKWEYAMTEIEESRKREIETMPLLDSRGDDGWEMVAVVASSMRDVYKVFFKRPIER